MAVTIPGQAELDGLLLGPGSPYGIKVLSGFGLPDGIRTDDTERPVDDGARTGDDYLPARSIDGLVNLRDGTPAGDLGAITDALVRAFRVRRSDPVPFVYWRPGDDAPRRAYVQPRRLSVDVDWWWHHGIADDVPFRLVAGDPRWYSEAASSAVLSLPVASEGREYPRVYPMAYGAGTSGTVAVVNDGNVTSYPVTVIAGPVTNPRVENVTTGEVLELALTVASGDTITIDHHDRTVMLNGTASRYGDLRRPVSWWGIAPGTNELRFGATAYDAAAQATVTFRSAWTG